MAGALLFALAACIVLTSTLSLLGSYEAHPSFIGIPLLLAAAFVMPWLGRKKRGLAAIASSAALRADAAESSLCGYLAGIALVGLAANAFWKESWIDPLSALVLIPIIVLEGWEAIRQSRLSSVRAPLSPLSVSQPRSGCRMWRYIALFDTPYLPASQRSDRTTSSGFLNVLTEGVGANGAVSGNGYLRSVRVLSQFLHL